MSRNNAPIILGGFYRSGTTLLRRLLDSHSRIHCGPEVKFFKDFYGDYLDDDLGHVRFFSTLQNLGFSLDELLPICGASFIRAHDLAARKSAKLRWADKNPENVLYLPQWRRLLPDGFLFIHVVRHPLDALASLKEIGFPKAVPCDFIDKVQLYLKYHDAAEAHIRKFPDSSIRLRYEDLTTRPEETLIDLFLSIGEVFEPTILSNFFSLDRGVGIEDPKVSHTRQIHSNSIGRWRKDLTKNEILDAEIILSKIIEKYTL